MQESFQEDAAAERRARALRSGRAPLWRALAGMVAIGLIFTVVSALRSGNAVPPPEPGVKASPAPPSTTTTPSPASSATPSYAPEDPKADRLEDVVFESVGASGTKKLDLTAAAQTGRDTERRYLDVVKARIPFMSQGKASFATIEADHAQHVPSRPSALFQGHVKITTEDGLVFTTDELLYDGKDGTAISERKVNMKRKSMEIEALGMIYDSSFDAIEFIKNVKIKMRDPDDPPADIEAGSACLSREQGALFLQENVRLVQGQNRAKATSLEIYFREDHRVQRAVFRDGFEIVTAGDTSGIGLMFPRAKGRKTLRGRRLEVALGENGAIQEVAAGPQGEMIIEPGPQDLPERRELRGEYLIFKFDEKGQLREYLGQNPSRVSFIPLNRQDGPPREVRSHDLVAMVNPATGEAENIDFLGEVVFERGAQRGRGDKATFQEKSGKLAIQGNAGFTDEAQHVDLSSPAIDIETSTGSFRAWGGVRHTQKGGLPGLPIGAGADLLATSKQVVYDAPKKETSYIDRVVFRAGSDELRADRVETTETPTGPNMLATGGVEVRVGGLAQAPGSGLGAQSGRMTYLSDRRRFLFEQNAVVTQATFETRAPAVQIDLSPRTALEVARLQTIGAGPVSIRAGSRVGEGAGLLFTPPDGRVQLAAGPQGLVKLQDAGQSLQGRQIVFFLGGGQVEVTGAGDGRTETVIQRKAKQ